MPNRTELLRLADECCAYVRIGDKWEMPPGLAHRLRDAFLIGRDAGSYIIVSFVERMTRLAMNGSWDAFVALLPERNGVKAKWRRDDRMVQVWFPGPVPAGRVDCDDPQPRHGVAAILRAMAEQVTE